MDLQEQTKTDIRQATVRLTKKKGLGVLVPGHFIITAAHCIDWEIEGGMILGDFSIENCETIEGRELKVTPHAVEPVRDIAILGELDNQGFAEKADAFERFCETTRPVRVCDDEFEPRTPFPAHILSHRGSWIEASAQLIQRASPMLWIDSQERIEGGTSGGPIVDSKGHLVGVVSHGGQSEWARGDTPARRVRTSHFQYGRGIRSRGPNSRRRWNWGVLVGTPRAPNWRALD